MVVKSKGGGDDDVKREKPFQAILPADSFSNNFRPISLEIPKVLCPLGGLHIGGILQMKLNKCLCSASATRT